MAEMEVRRFPMLAWVSVAFGAIAAFWSLVFFLTDGLPEKIHWIAAIGSLTLAVALLWGGIYFARKPVTALRLTDSNLQIPKYSLEIPWLMIESAEVILPHDRKSAVGKFSSDAVDLSMTGRIRRDRFLAITLTKEGRSQFGDRDYVGKQIRKSLKIHEDVLISPVGLYIPESGYERENVLHDVADEIMARIQVAERT